MGIISRRSSSVIHTTHPRINVIDENWKRTKCDMLGISFVPFVDQPSNIIGQSLSGFEPSETDYIEGDGNCLFRCLSKLVTGSENSHLQLRSIISRFIASEGTKKPGLYSKTKQMTPCEYLSTHVLIESRIFHRRNFRRWNFRLKSSYRPVTYLILFILFQLMCLILY